MSKIVAFNFKNKFLFILNTSNSKNVLLYKFVIALLKSGWEKHEKNKLPNNIVDLIRSLNPSIFYITLRHPFSTFFIFIAIVISSDNMHITAIILVKFVELTHICTQKILSPAGTSTSFLQTSSIVLTGTGGLTMYSGLKTPFLTYHPLPSGLGILSSGWHACFHMKASSFKM